MARCIDHINNVVSGRLAILFVSVTLLGMNGPKRRTTTIRLFNYLELERDGAALHSDSALLFVLSTVHVSHLSRHARGDYIVCGEKSVHECRLSMVDVT
jgi:hypothetical protein